jgi:hypothetical protein
MGVAAAIALAVPAVALAANTAPTYTAGHRIGTSGTSTTSHKVPATSTFTGSVTAVNGSSFTLQSKARGSQTVSTDSTTVFNKNGAVDSSGIADVAVGSNVTVAGTWDSTVSTVAATKVNIVVRTATTTGTVTAVSGNTISMTGTGSAATAYTVDATNAKVYRKYGATMQVSVIQTGDTLQVRGPVNGAIIAATTIRDQSQQQRNGTFTGSVTAVSGSSFTIQSKARSSQTVSTDSTTVFDKNGAVDSSGVADVAVGSNVTVTGLWDSTNSNVAASKVNVVIKMVSTTITGTLSGISSTTLTVTNTAGTSYTVDATKARVTYKNGHSGSLSILVAGDSLTVYARGASGATSVTASLVRDTSQTYSAKGTAAAVLTPIPTAAGQ